LRNDFIGNGRRFFFQGKGDEMGYPQTMATPEQESRVISKAVMRAATHLGLNDGLLAKIVGLSPATISRLRNGSFLLARDSKPFELAQFFLRLFRGLDAITGSDDEAARSWLNGANTALHNRKPVDLIQNIAGLMQVVSYVDARRAVI
jgi:uncharacterized protein (DUF2384 family)